jgi:uncharacterized protein
MINIDFISLVPFLLLLVSVWGLWLHRAVWMSALVLAVIAGYFTGALHGLAALWFFALAALAAGYAAVRNRAAGVPKLRTLQIALGIAFALLALALAFNQLPGVPRTSLTGDLVLSPGAAAYNLGLGFSKVIAGILILGLVNPLLVKSWGEFAKVLRRAAPIYFVTVVVVMAFTLATGYVVFDPKWTPLFIAWAFANLFFTCLSEEALFRAFLQRELSTAGGGGQLAVAIAVGVSAVLFGLAHLGGGWTYAIAASFAGLGYALAFQVTQRVEAGMAVHFGLNAAHFLLFTYPMLA